jgi:nifR3 family TIM-barrel protein
MTTSTFWQTLPRPLFGLAPMNGITDHPFRHIQKKYGNPPLLYTEFTGVERIHIGDRDLLRDFLYDESQRPIIGQIYGRQPALFRRMAVMLCELGFDGIDINMGCPTRAVADRGSGAGLILTPLLAQEIIRETKAGVADWRNGASVRDDPGVPRRFVEEVEVRHRALPVAARQRRPIPVSVKTRIGYAAPQVREWIPRVLEAEPAALALHGRTLRQLYTGQADWDEIGVAAGLCRAAGVPLLGNGDVRSLEDANQRVQDFGVDGVLIGRASYGNPFIFRPSAGHGPAKPEPLHLLAIGLEHARMYQETISFDSRNRFMPMRKHLSWYVRSLPSAAALRTDLIKVSSVADVEAILDRYYARQHIAPGEPPAPAQAFADHINAM